MAGGGITDGSCAKYLLLFVYERAELDCKNVKNAVRPLYTTVHVRISLLIREKNFVGMSFLASVGGFVAVSECI